MEAGQTNPKVDWYFSKEEKWKKEIESLRKIILSCALCEELKWGTPCYTLPEGGNVVLIHVFKEYCAILFFKGALLSDPEKVMVQQSKNTQATRQMRFKSIDEIKNQKDLIKANVLEALQLEKNGAKVVLKKTEEFEMVDEFHDMLKEVKGLKAAFEALTPGRQRAYLLHFASAKQAKTRIARITACIPHIFDGKGLNDFR